MGCQSFAEALHLRPEDLEPGEASRLMAHLEACPACRALAHRSHRASEAVQAAGRAFAMPPAPKPLQIPARAVPARLGIWGAVAAMLLVALWMRPWTSSKPSVSPQIPEQSEAFPPPFRPFRGNIYAQGQDLEGPIGRASLLTLRKDSRMRRESDGSLVLVQGDLCLEATGEALRLAMGGCTVETQDALLSLSLPPSPATAWTWIREAWAGDAPAGTAVVWHGEAVVRAGSQSLTLKAGQACRLGENGPAMVPVPESIWKPETAWTPLMGIEAQSLRDALLTWPVPTSGYVLEYLVRKEVPHAEMGLRVAVPEGVYEIPVGTALPTGLWMRIRIVYGGGRCQATVGETPIVDAPFAGLSRSGWMTTGQEGGLRVWGGGMTVREARWRPPGP